MFINLRLKGFLRSLDRRITVAKHKEQHEGGGVAVEEEQPKQQKVGDKPETAPTTAVDAKEKKTRKVTPKNTQYRILDGVDGTKFIGQRGKVIQSLQKLAAEDPDRSWTPEEIAANTEGLVSKTPVLASVTYHLKNMVAENMVVAIEPPKVEVAA